jgi:hypothetical protein
MKILVSFLLLLCTAAPAAALTSEEASKIVRWATGDTIMVEVIEDSSPNGYFSLADGWIPTIVIFQPAWMPDSWAIVILLHEAAHYLQWRDGYLFGRPLVEVEWEADVMGMNMACQRGVTLRDFHDLFAWAIEHYGDATSWSHGQRSLRMLNGLSRAHACKTSVQAPWQAA